MKINCIIFLLLLSCSLYAQRDANPGAKQFYNKIFDYNYVEKKPVFAAGEDSLRRFYLSRFTALDSLVARTVSKGDTAKYIRVHFEFIIDENGIPYSGEFSYIGSTKYGASKSDKKIKYFNDLKKYFNDAIKEMIKKMPNWRPALQNNVRVKCSVDDYFQIWLGINPEN
ncbi:MAG: hypothetical protein KF781_08430 [Chitinophagaceae bacterium]|nr:hypothetical protein [Chitinophagaceae bacterium]MCW5905783.1 hypothetical protein [Chitinophagaceae bacterium]